MNKFDNTENIIREEIREEGKKREEQKVHNHISEN